MRLKNKKPHSFQFLLKSYKLYNEQGNIQVFNCNKALWVKNYNEKEVTKELGLN